jgi:hypothetical protein
MSHRFCSTVPTGAAPLLLALALVGCGKEPAEPKTADAKKAGVFPLQPRPVTVTVTRESGHAASASIPVGGGTLTAVGGDGSRYTLTVPPKALDGDTTITMTPVSGIGGLPMSGGLVAAVHLEPEGLRFNLPGVLSIEPAREVPVKQQLGFGYLGGGSDLHLYPLERGRPLAMKVVHFSGIGVAAGTPADVGALRQRPPADATAQLEQQIADLLNAERQAGLTGEQGDPEFSSKLSDLLRDFYDHVVLPKLDAAKATDDWRVMFDGVQTAMSFVRISAMVGEDAEALSKLLPIMEPILVRGFDRAYDRCTRKLGGDKEARLLMIITRNAALTRFGVSPTDERFSQRKIEECFGGGMMLPEHLELSVETLMEYSTEDTEALLSAGTATMILDQTPGSTTYYARGWTPIAYREFRFIRQSGCPRYNLEKLHDGEWKVDLFVHPDGKIAASILYKFEGIPWEEVRSIDCDGTAKPPEQAQWWFQGLNSLQQKLTQENAPGYAGIPTGMTFLPAPGILSATIERTDFNRVYKRGVFKLGLKVLP